MKKRIWSIITCLALCLGLLPTAALAEDAPHAAHCVCGKGSSETVDGHTHSASMPEWTGTATLSNDMSAGYYYLTADVTLSSWWSPADGTVLCLNGHTVTAASNNYAVFVGNGAAFTLTDCSNNTTSGYLDAAWSLWHAGSSTEVGSEICNLTGGVITGACGTNTNYGAIYVAGTFEMYGGNIAGNDKRGGVTAASGSIFTMYGGKICGNFSTGNAGGVVLTNAAFTMYGGEIAYNKGNSSQVSGGGVYVGNGATFTMSDEAKVVGNETNGDGGGIYVENGGSADLKGSASVTNNCGSEGGGIYVANNGVLKLTDSASVTNNTGGGIYGYKGSEILLQAGNSGQIKVSANQGDAGIRANGKLTLEGRSDASDSIFISENKIGGIYSENGSLTISGSTISGNTGYQGVCAKGENISLTISDSIISGNNVGGIYMGSGTGTVKNTKITGNQARRGGGGIYIVLGGKMILSDVEITGNSAGTQGGGIYQTGATGLTLAGKMTIASNTVNSQENNLLFHSDSGGTVQIGVTDEDGTTTSLTKGSQIGVTYQQLIPTEDSPLAVTGTNDADYSKYFSSDNAAYGTYNGEGNKVMLGVNKTITYDANGGSGTQAEDAYPINGTFTLPESTTFTPPDDGKKFKGWALTPGGEIVKTHVIDDDTTFYAIWYDYKVEITGVEAATGLVYNGQPHTGYTGNIQSGNYVGEYTATYAGTTAANTTYGPTTTAPTEAGSYTVTLSIPAGATYGGYEYAGESAPVAFTIGKAVSSVGSAPTAINPTYNGTAQYLVTMGEATGGEMRYAVGTDSTTVPTEGWSTTIPTATNAGTYYVWYKVLGDSNHNDSAPVCIEAKIEKAILDVSAKNYLLAVNSPAPDLTSADAYTITGFVGSETAEVVTGAPVLSYAFDESPDMSKEGYYFIEVDTEGMSAVNYDFNAISGELRVVTCVHDFTEFSVSTSADGTASSILAKCNNNCAEFEHPAEIITITAPENPVYEQGLEHTASLSYNSQVQVDSEDIVYSGDPVDAGTYTASITYGGKTASVTYTVAPRTLTVKADNKSVYVNGSEPAYTYTVTGWDRGHDDEDPYSHQLSGVTAICADADLTKTGSYIITLSGTPKVEELDGESKADVSANYSFILENGTLTVRNQPSSGGESTPTYSPTIEDNAGGNTTVSNKNPECGDKVTITTEPNEGYQVGEVIVTDRNGNEVEVTDNGDGTYSFKQPSGKVNIEVTYVLKQYFTDVSENAYYFDAVLWALDEGITSGTSATTFSPDAACTRAQMATFLWRAAGSPAPKGNSNPFTDVSADAYYAEAVQWAVEQGITVGTSATTFSPDADCTRAQMAVFIYRNEQAKGGGFTGAWMFRLPFTDTPEWAYEAIAWCYKEGITEGTGATTFSPDAPCTRAQMVTFLYRFFVK